MKYLVIPSIARGTAFGMYLTQGDFGDFPKEFVVSEVNVYIFLVRKPEERQPFTKHRRREEANIKVGLNEMGLSEIDWIRLAENKVYQQVYLRILIDLKVGLLAVLIEGRKRP